MAAVHLPGSATATTDLGNLVLTVRADIPEEQQDDGDYVSFQSDTYGAVRVIASHGGKDASAADPVPSRDQRIIDLLSSLLTETRLQTLLLQEMLN